MIEKLEPLAILPKERNIYEINLNYLQKDTVDKIIEICIKSDLPIEEEIKIQDISCDFTN